MAQNKYVAIEYKLYVVDNGRKALVEKTMPNQPFTFISGFGIALDSLEERLLDMDKNSEFDITLTKDEAFGDFYPERVVELEKEKFSINGHFDAEHIYQGAMIPLQNEDGTRFMGLVKDVTDTMVVVDLNHELAGRTINFMGKVLENREATDDEINKMIKMMTGECGCGGCGGQCGGDCHCGQ